MVSAKHEQVKALVDSAAGTIFSAWFIKQNGEARQMICRTNVKKGVKGVGRTFDPDEKGLVPVFDVEKQRKLMNEDSSLDSETAASKSFRFITSDKVFALKIRGTIIRMDEKPTGFEFPADSVFAKD